MRLERANRLELQVSRVVDCLSDTAPTIALKAGIGRVLSRNKIQSALRRREHLVRTGLASLHHLTVIELLQQLVIILVSLLVLLKTLIQGGMHPHTIASHSLMTIPLHLAVIELIDALAEAISARATGLGHHLRGQELVILDLVQMMLVLMVMVVMIVMVMLVLLMWRRQPTLSSICTTVPRTAALVVIIIVYILWLRWWRLLLRG